MGRCLFCRRPAVHWHHPTGRLGPDQPNLDPHFVIPLCRACHVAEHAAWADAGIADIDDPLLARMLRIAWLFGHRSDAGGPLTLRPEAVRGLHGSILASIVLIEQRWTSGART